MKFETVSNHAPQEGDVCTPLRLREIFRGHHQQQRDRYTHQNTRRRVPPYERLEISLDQEQDANCVDKHKRLADKIEDIEMTYPSQRQQNVETNQRDHLKRDRD